MKLFYTFLALVSGGLVATAQLQSFEPTSDVSGKEFGTQVAISGNEILASTVSTETTPGKVYLFNTNLQQTGIFYPEDAQLTDGFGASFSIDSDFIAIGAPNYDGNNVDSGATYIYHKINDEWQFFQKITAVDNNIGDAFGSVVKLYNNQLFVSAIKDGPDNFPMTNDKGSVYVYNWDGTQWSFSEKLVSVLGTLFFGNKIEVDNTTLVISSGYDLQECHIYDKNNLQWESTQVLSWPFDGESDRRDMSLDNHKLYILTGVFGNSGVIIFQQNEAGIWVETDLGAYESFYAELIGPIYYLFDRVEVNGDKAYFGIVDQFGFQSGDKFPVVCFKKNLPWPWIENRIYSNGPSGQDDRFGSAMAVDSQSIVIGASKEGNGKAYFASQDALGVTSLQQSTTTVYPNPVDNILNIKGNFIDISNTEVYSITGKLLLSIESNSREIDMTNFDSGMYFIRITTTAGTTQSFKIIKK